MTVSRVLAGPLAGAAVWARAGEASSAATTAVASAERWVCMTTPKTWVAAGPGKAGGRSREAETAAAKLKALIIR
ncbi:hypothetical protein BRM11_11450 [Xanthomonas oryzae pv. oryzae]|nr:hypothetical protein BRM11_11450 [Xanthomonas oryzae pv. oryzae]